MNHETISGEAAACVLAGAVGCTAFGVFSVLSFAFAPVRELFTLSVAAGSLTGTASAATFFFVLAWFVLHYALRARKRSARAVTNLTVVGVALGILLTFPPIYENIGRILTK